ncbi:MAG: acylphosphatase [Firmicutes bacterium]|nr:acylphosphatase [Bacillota bacterium]
MKPIEALKSARNTYICHQVNRVRLPDFEENRFVRRHITFHGRVQRVGFRIELAQMAERLELTGWVKNAENGKVIAEVQGFESRIRFLLKFMNSLKRIKIRKMENKPHSIKETETEFRIL